MKYKTLNNDLFFLTLCTSKVITLKIRWDLESSSSERTVHNPFSMVFLFGFQIASLCNGFQFQGFLKS